MLFERELRELEYTMDDIEFNDAHNGGEGYDRKDLIFDLMRFTKEKCSGFAMAIFIIKVLRTI